MEVVVSYAEPVKTSEQSEPNGADGITTISRCPSLKSLTAHSNILSIHDELTDFTDERHPQNLAAITPKEQLERARQQRKLEKNLRTADRVSLSKYLKYCFILLTYTLDVGVNVWFAIHLWLSGYRTECIVSLSILATGSVAAACLDCVICRRTHMAQNSRMTTVACRIFRCFVTFTIMAPLYRIVDLISTVRRNRRTKGLKERFGLKASLVQKELDLLHLRLVYAFLHSALQSILSLYIQLKIAKGQYTQVSQQIIAMPLLWSGVSTSLTIASFKTTLMPKQENGINKWLIRICVFSWYGFTFFSRIVALSVFLEAFGVTKFLIFFFISLFIRVLASLLMETHQPPYTLSERQDVDTETFAAVPKKTPSKPNVTAWLCEYLFRIFILYINVLCYLSVVPPSTLGKSMVLYYVIIVVEDAYLIYLYNLKKPDNILSIACFVGICLIAGIICLMVVWFRYERDKSYSDEYAMQIATGQSAIYSDPLVSLFVKLVGMICFRMCGFRQFSGGATTVKQGEVAN